MTARHLNQVEGYHNAPCEVHTAFVGKQVVESAVGIERGVTQGPLTVISEKGLEVRA